MNRKVIITKDGSSTIAISDKNITYHSMFGALQESKHIYIDNGLRYFIHHNVNIQPVHIFEMGFGTGLNALLSLQYAIENNVQICYTCIEAFPLTAQEAEQLNYIQLLKAFYLKNAFMQMHKAEHNMETIIHPLFNFKKCVCMLNEFLFTDKFHIAYYDAFAPDDMPALWTKEIFTALYQSLFKKGLFVTYSSKSVVRKTLSEVGFTIEKLKGPPGKREITRAIKP